jgi:hypothetical protein
MSLSLLFKHKLHFHLFQFAVLTLLVSGGNSCFDVPDIKFKINIEAESSEPLTALSDLLTSPLVYS